MSRVRTRERAFADVGERDVAAWRGLAAAAAEPNVFFEPGVLLPAVRHLGARTVRLVTVEDDDGWLAALPVERRWVLNRLLGPWLLGWCHTHAFLGTPLLAAARLSEAADALVGHLARRRGVASFGFPRLGLGGPVEAALRDAAARRGLAVVVTDEEQRAALYRDDSGRFAAPKGKARKQVAQDRRQLEEACGAELVLERGDGRDPEQLERFLALEHAGWKGAAGTSLRASPGGEAFLRATWEGLAADGALMLNELRADGRTVAMACDLRSGDSVFLFKTTYDERWRSFAPGVQLLEQIVDGLAELPDVRHVDSCAAAGNVALERLLRDRRSVATVAVPRGRAAARSLRLSMRLRDAVRARRASRRA